MRCMELPRHWSGVHRGGRAPSSCSPRAVSFRIPERYPCHMVMCRATRQSCEFERRSTPKASAAAIRTSSCCADSTSRRASHSASIGPSPAWRTTASYASRARPRGFGSRIKRLRARRAWAVCRRDSQVGAAAVPALLAELRGSAAPTFTLAWRAKQRRRLRAFAAPSRQHEGYTVMRKRLRRGGSEEPENPGGGERIRELRSFTAVKSSGWALWGEAQRSVRACPRRSVRMPSFWERTRTTFQRFWKVRPQA